MKDIHKKMVIERNDPELLAITVETLMGYLLKFYVSTVSDRRSDQNMP